MNTSGSSGGGTTAAGGSEHLTVEIVVDINRLSLSLLRKVPLPLSAVMPMKQGPLSKLKVTIQTKNISLFSINFYGSQLHSNDSILTCKLGSLRVLDQDSNAVITCGSDPDLWLDDYQVNEVQECELALYLSINIWKSTVQSKLAPDMRYKSYLRDQESNFESFETDENPYMVDQLYKSYTQVQGIAAKYLATTGAYASSGSKQSMTRDELSRKKHQDTIMEESSDHIIIELRVSLLTYRWDVEFMEYLQHAIVEAKNTCSVYSYLYNNSVPTHSYADDNTLPSDLNDSITLGSSLTRMEQREGSYPLPPAPPTASKMSLDITCQGFKMRIPCYSHIPEPPLVISGLAHSRYNASSSSGVESTERFKILSISLGKMTMYSGDFLESWMNRRSSLIPATSPMAPEDASPGLKAFEIELEACIQTSVPTRDLAAVPPWFRSGPSVQRQNQPRSSVQKTEHANNYSSYMFPWHSTDHDERASDDDEDDEEGLYDADGAGFDPSLARIEADRYAWGSIDHNLKIAARKMDINDVPPIVFSLPKIEVSIVISSELMDFSRDEVVTQLTSEPWQLSGAIGLSQQKTVSERGDEGRLSGVRVGPSPMAEINLHMSPLKIASTFEVCRSLIYIYMYIYMRGPFKHIHYGRVCISVSLFLLGL